MRVSQTAVAAMAGAFALAMSFGPAMAQGGPIDPGVYTTTTVHWMHPFDSPDVIADDALDISDIGAIVGNYDDGDLLEIRQRCSVVTTNPEGDVGPYAEMAVDFCVALYAWVAENRPDAPDTDAALAGM